MTKAERQERILTLIARQPDINVQNMSTLLEVSEVTIRKDLTSLADEGKIKRSYGKVELIGGYTKPTASTSCFIAPELQNDYKMKQVIGSLAAGLVSDEDYIFLGPGYTCLEVANNLKSHQRLSVVTMNVSAAIELSDVPESKILLAHGEFTKRNGTYYVTGAATARCMEDLFVDKAFITADGISIERGLTVLDEITMEIFKKIVKPNTKVIVCVASTKFNRSALTQLGDLTFANAIVTDKRPDDTFMHYFYAHGIDVIYPGI